MPGVVANNVAEVVFAYMLAWSTGNPVIPATEDLRVLVDGRVARRAV